MNTAQPSIQEVPLDWKTWMLHNYTLGVPTQVILETLANHGFNGEDYMRFLGSKDTLPLINALKKEQQKTQKRNWILNTLDQLSHLSPIWTEIPRHCKPSREVFLAEYYATNRPVIITDAINDWSALRRWTPEYLKRHCGHVSIEIQNNRNSNPLYEINSPQLKETTLFHDYVQRIQQTDSSNDFYITANNAHANKKLFALLQKDIGLLEDYLTSKDGFFWYGPAGTVTPLHHDLTNNFMVQVQGRKVIHLVSALGLPNIYR
jgi:hypothetical protein